MAKYSSYNGGIEVISGFTQKNGGSFALVDAHDVQVDEDDTRLDAALKNLENKLSTAATVLDDGEGNVTVTYLSPNLNVTDNDSGDVVITSADS